MFCLNCKINIQYYNGIDYYLKNCSKNSVTFYSIMVLTIAFSWISFPEMRSERDIGEHSARIQLIN